MKRIIKGPHVGIDLLLKRAGEKAEAFTCFHRGARQDDAVYLLREQRGNSHSHGQVGFSVSSRSDGEHHVVTFERFDITALVGTLRGDAFLAKGAGARRRKSTAQLERRFSGRDAEERFYFLAAWNAPFADSIVVFGQNLSGALHLSRSAFDFKIMVLQVGSNV